jgi:hypothetical protein
VTRPFIALLLLFAFAPTAHAQLASADARFSVGIAVDRLFTLDGDANDTWGVGPVFRIGPDRGGWGPAFGFAWFEADLPASVGGVTGDFAQLKVRPVMGGVSYTIRRGPWSYDIGMTVGWTFNSAKLLPAAERYFESVDAGPVDVEVTNSFAARPRLRVYYDTSTRVALMGAAGVLFVDPEVTLRSGSQSITFDRNLTSFTLEAGIVFALF